MNINELEITPVYYTQFRVLEPKLSLFKRLRERLKSKKRKARDVQEAIDYMQKVLDSHIEEQLFLSKRAWEETVLTHERLMRDIEDFKRKIGEL